MITEEKEYFDDELNPATPEKATQVIVNRIKNGRLIGISMYSLEKSPKNSQQ